MEFWRAGLIASTLANLHRKKGKKPYTPEDFMPNGVGKRKRRKSQTADDMLRQVKALGAIYG